MSIAAGPALPCIVSRPSMREGALGVGKPDAIRSPRLRNVKRSRNETGRGMRTEHRRKVVCWCESVDASDEMNIRSADYSFAGGFFCLVCQCFPARTE